MIRHKRRPAADYATRLGLHGDNFGGGAPVRRFLDGIPASGCE
jgi:hypothetical protein